jgi:hypothetical protein
MTQPRNQLVDPTHAGTFHCVNRCVRRSWRCGFDKYLGESYEDRKSWAEARIMKSLILTFFGLLLAGTSMANDPVWSHSRAGDGNFPDIAHTLLVADQALYVAGGVSRSAGDLQVPRGFLARHDQQSGAQLWAVEILPASLNTLGLQCSVARQLPNSLGIAVGCSSAIDGYGVFVFSADGAPRWSVLIGTSDAEQDVFGGLAVDTQGRLFLAGTHRTGAIDSVRVHALSPGGQALWNADYPGPENAANAVAIVADELGGAVVAGTITTKDRYIELLVVRFSAIGALAWHRGFGGPDGGSIDEASDLVLHGGEIYVAGTINGDTEAGSDGFLARLGMDGSPAWQVSFDAGTGSAESFRALAVDAGGAYAVGASTMDGDRSDTLIAAFSPQGALSWSHRTPAAFGTQNRYWDIDLDAAGKPHVAGAAALVFGSTAAIYDSFSTDGRLLRREAYTGPVGVAEARALGVDSGGNVYLAGTVTATSTGFDAMTLRYDEDQLFSDGFGPSH